MWILDGNNIEAFTEFSVNSLYKRLGGTMFSREDIYVIGILPCTGAATCEDGSCGNA